MFSRVRAFAAPALVLLAACPASAAAQQRQCSAADSARVAWSPPPGTADDAWRATLLAGGLVAPETRLVRVPHDSLHSLGGDREHTRALQGVLLDAIEARVGAGPSRTVALLRVEPDSTVSRLVLSLPSGMVEIDSAGQTRLRFAPAAADGCPMAIWYPVVIEQSATVTIPARPSAQQAVRVGSFEVQAINATGEDRSSAAVTPRGTRRGQLQGQLMWRCAEGGGLWAGVVLARRARAGESRPVEWRFDDDAPRTATLRGVEGYSRWFLPPGDVAGFTVRARTARSLSIRLTDDGTEYVYELDQPGQALDRVACARGTPVAGEIPRATTDFTGVGTASPRS